MNPWQVTARSFYVVGGTMPPDSESYIERSADAELFGALMDGELCYVLTARQMGKSSLMARTATRLTAAGVRTATVDLTSMGSGAAAEWYYGFCHSLLRQIGVDIELRAWWQSQENLPHLQRLTELFLEIIRRTAPRRVVVFVDEIDYTISLPFAGDFFSAIRAVYNARALKSELQRLSFVLLGVASPTELIQDQTRTPFNVGRRIELSDFTRDQMRVLVRALRCHGPDEEQVLDRLMYWTAGHPYLAQKVCRSVAESDRNCTTPSSIDEAVNKIFFGRHAVQSEDNLRFVASRLDRDFQRNPALPRLLTRIRHSGVIYNSASHLHSALKLTGIVAVKEDGTLAIRNRIYERVFSVRWTKTDKALAMRWRRRSLDAAFVGDRDRALLARIRCLAFQDTPVDRQEATQLIQNDYNTLAVTFRHGAPVTVAEYSPDESRVLTAAEDGTVGIWNAGTGDLILPWMKHRGPVWAAAFAPDGAVFASGSADRTARIWDTATGAQKSRQMRHDDAVWVVKFSPDSHVLLTCSDDGTARLWESESGKAAGPPLQHGAPVEAADFSPNGCLVATGSADGQVRIWSVEDGRVETMLPRQTGHVGVARFSRDGSLLLTAGEGKSAILWDVNTGVIAAGPFLHEGWIRTASFIAGTTEIATGGEDMTVRIWSANPDRAVCELRHGHWVRALGVEGDGRLIVTGTEENRARLWRLPSGELAGYPLRHRGRVMVAGFGPGNRTVLTAGYDGTARLWSTKAIETTARDGCISLGGELSAAELSPDGRILVAAVVNHPDRSFGSVRLWRDGLQGDGIAVQTGTARTRVIAFAADSSCFVTGSDDGLIAIHCSTDGSASMMFDAHTGRVHAAAVSVAGGFAATGGADAVVLLWSLSDRSWAGRFDHYGEAITNLAFSSDGAWLLTASNQNKARMWNVKSGSLELPPMLHEGAILAMAFSPDDGVIVTASQDHTARLWRAGSGRQVNVPLQHNEAVVSVAFSPDCTTVITGSRDRTVRLWRADTGAPIGKPLEHPEPVERVAFSTDGAWFVCATQSAIWFYRRDGERLAVRLLDGSWYGCWSIESDNQARVRVAETLTPDLMKLSAVSAYASGTAVTGDGPQLLRDWERRLGLRVDERDRIVPACRRKAGTPVES